MIQYRRISFVGLLVVGAFYSVTPGLAGEPLPAYTYSDQQLLEAGWTDTQIADLRATAPKNPTVTEGLQEAAKPEDPFRSVFRNYKSFEYLPDTDWQKANDEVGRIGGWRSYARQVQQEQKQEAKAREIAREEKRP